MILIDTNILLTLLLSRPNLNKEYVVLDHYLMSGNICVFACQIRDVHYLLRRSGVDENKARVILLDLMKPFILFSTEPQDIVSALSSPVSDYEDAILVEGCKRVGVTSIYTENAKDFVLSGLKIIDALA
ncbi:MAG: hypothetical protein BWY98_00275 [Tenericutes bacterium ADurb.BinA155]|jgi:predicted nucleic acid-binding protein|nr:MAG: hypothetical protein BWY98_00275 [Tenericutes bacterium ADurb.BinA155]